MMLVLFSCQKDVEKKNNNDQLISKVNNWLDKQKSVNQPNRAANVDILKENIDFSGLRYEDLNVNERFIVMPIKDDYRIKKNIDNSTVPVLLLVMNTMGDIIRGNIVLFFPEDKKQIDKIPDNTFSKMYKEETINCNGLFRFLSPTGRWMYQREYKNGKLHSFGVVKPGEKAEARTETECTYYFLILTYWEDGVIVNQESIYLGSICQSGCDDPNIQSLCPDGGGGSGGGEASVDESCINAAVEEFQQEVDGAQVASQTESITISPIDPFTKNKNPKWKILTGAGGWKLISQETGVIKLIDVAENKWAWKSLVHGTISMEGSPLPTTSIEYNQGVGTPSFTPEAAETTNVFYGGMSLDFTVTYRLVCNCPNVPVVGWLPPINIPYTSNAIWDASPI